jgi:hypothetical protein
MLVTASCWRECTRYFCFAAPSNFAFTWATALTIRINSCPVKCSRNVDESVAGTPVILHLDTYDLWLDPGFTDATAATEMLKPYDARLMRSYPVSTRINHTANDDAECAKPLEIETPPQGQLFA